MSELHQRENAFEIQIKNGHEEKWAKLLNSGRFKKNKIK